MLLEIRGAGADLLDGEAGAVRVQRIPATERSGRVHSSTVTVAVMRPGAEESGPESRRGPADFRIEWYNGTVKAGGQHHQKNATCCRMIHVPTGLVKTAQTRSRANSLQEARAAMDAELDRRGAASAASARNGLRREQVGTGQRADKRRTFRFQDDRATDHVTGKTAACSAVMAGRFRLLAR